MNLLAFSLRVQKWLSFYAVSATACRQPGGCTILLKEDAAYIKRLKLFLTDYNFQLQ
jgi:NADPH-dependent glutamate synthase beta subunit-like oxidoreductase